MHACLTKFRTDPFCFCRPPRHMPEGVRDAREPDAERPDGADGDALAAVEYDIAERLESVCRNWPEARYQQLVHDLAAVKLKYGMAKQEFEYLRWKYEQNRDRLFGRLGEREARP